MHFGGTRNREGEGGGGSRLTFARKGWSDDSLRKLCKANLPRFVINKKCSAKLITTIYGGTEN